MAAKSFLRLVTGRIKEIAGIVISAGAGNDGDIPALDATGRLDTSVMPVGIGADTKSVISSENLAAGDFVDIYDNAGTLNVRKADATAAGKEADGFVLAGVTSPAPAIVYFAGINTQLSSLTLGASYFLSATTPGVATATPPSGTGKVVQELGVAISATELQTQIAGRGIVLV